MTNSGRGDGTRGPQGHRRANPDELTPDDLFRPEPPQPQQPDQPTYQYQQPQQPAQGLNWQGQAPAPAYGHGQQLSGSDHVVPQQGQPWGQPPQGPVPAQPSGAADETQVMPPYPAQPPPQAQPQQAPEPPGAVDETRQLPQIPPTQPGMTSSGSPFSIRPGLPSGAYGEQPSYATGAPSAPAPPARPIEPTAVQQTSSVSRPRPQAMGPTPAPAPAPVQPPGGSEETQVLPPVTGAPGPVPQQPTMAQPQQAPQAPPYATPPPAHAPQPQAPMAQQGYQPGYQAPPPGYQNPQPGYQDPQQAGGYTPYSPQPAPYQPEPAGPSRAAGGSRRRLSPMAIAGIVVAACAVVGIVAGGVLSSGGDDDKKDTAGSKNAAATTSGAPSAKAAADPVEEQAKGLDALLKDSNNSRAAVISAVGQIKSCKNLDGAAQSLRDAAGQRNDLIKQLSALPVDKLPNHKRLTSELNKAWSSSASADNHYAGWADDVAGKGGCKKGRAKITGNAQQATVASGRATQAKAQAAKLWNVLARKYGLTERSSTQL